MTMYSSYLAGIHNTRSISS